MRRQPLYQTLYFAIRHHGAGWIIGVGQKHQARTLAAGGQYCVNIRVTIALGHLNWRGPSRQGRNAIHRKPMFGMDHFIAGPSKCLAEQCNNFIAAHAANYALGIQIIFCGDRRA